jgi:hypothetical protein
MKFRSLPALLITAALITAALTGCFQELPLGDKYINEAVGFLRVQNTSAETSYILDGLELRDAAGEVIKTWDGLKLERGGTWTGDVDREGSLILYCTVRNTAEKTAGTFEHGAVEIKLHAVTESKITGEVYLSTADTDGDGFSDSWELAHEKEGFNPNDAADGGPVYVRTTGNDQNPGTADRAYKTLAKGLEKAKYGLKDETRTVLVEGSFSRATEGTANTATSMIHITDTGLHGVTIVGVGTTTITGSFGNSQKRAIYLGPGTKLTLKNITIQGGQGYRGGGVHAKGAVLTLGAGAVIQGCKSDAGGSSGGGLYAENGAQVVMENGSLISGNKGLLGAAVALLNGSSLIMKDGSRIADNHFDRSAAVAADLGSTVTLEPGAEITGTKNDYNPNFKIISHGGGVRLTGGSRLIMNGGLISGNALAKGGGGGGVYVGAESIFEMRDGTISGNEANENEEQIKGNGGGVYVDSGGQFSMSGGIIANNTAAGQGGGVYIDRGKFFKASGGIVYGEDNITYKNTAGPDGSRNGDALFATNPGRSIDQTQSSPLTL